MPIVRPEKDIKLQEANSAKCRYVEDAMKCRLCTSVCRERYGYETEGAIMGENLLFTAQKRATSWNPVRAVYADIV